MLSVLWILWNPIVGSLLASVLAIYYWIQTRFERQSWQTYQLVRTADDFIWHYIKKKIFDFVFTRFKTYLAIQFGLSTGERLDGT
jgi:hypothetical protein